MADALQKAMARRLAAMANLAPQAYSFAPCTFVLPADHGQLLEGESEPARR